MERSGIVKNTNYFEAQEIAKDQLFETGKNGRERLFTHQKKIQHEPYHKKLMRSFGFKKHGNYWIKK